MRFLGSVMIGSLWLVSGASAQRAQLVFGAGPTLPSGSYGVYAKTGWLINAGARLDVGTKGAWVGGELVYGRNSHSDVVGDKTSVPGLFAHAGYRFGEKGRMRPFVLGGLGFLNHQFGTAGPTSGGGSYGVSDWGVAFTAGGGVEIPAGKMAVRAEARYVARKETSFVPLQLGISVPLGR